MTNVESEGSRHKAQAEPSGGSLSEALIGVSADDLRAAAATLERFEKELASAVEALHTSLREFLASEDGRVFREYARALLDEAAKAAHERALEGDVERDPPVARTRRIPTRRKAALSGFADLVDLFPESRRSRAHANASESRRNP